MTDTAPTTDCPTCGTSAHDCNQSRAKGWDNCCMKCDERGQITNHRLRAVSVSGAR